MVFFMAFEQFLNIFDTPLSTVGNKLWVGCSNLDYLNQWLIFSKENLRSTLAAQFMDKLEGRHHGWMRLTSLNDPQQKMLPPLSLYIFLNEA
jgi:hypothetical protein